MSRFQRVSLKELNFFAVAVVRGRIAGKFFAVTDHFTGVLLEFEMAAPGMIHSVEKAHGPVMRIAVYVHASTSLATIIIRSYGQAVLESTPPADIFFHGGDSPCNGQAANRHIAASGPLFQSLQNREPVGRRPIAFASAFAVRPTGFKNSSLRISPAGTGRIPFFFILLLLNDSPATRHEA
jgi:hypothetical protein